MSSERILLVEDDENLRVILQLQLEKLGYTAAPAGDAEQALDILRKTPQDLVITDLQLPGMSGIGLVKKIQADFPEVPSIVVTAFGTVQSAVSPTMFPNRPITDSMKSSDPRPR